MCVCVCLCAADQLIWPVDNIVNIIEIPKATDSNFGKHVSRFSPGRHDPFKCFDLQSYMTPKN